MNLVEEGVDVAIRLGKLKWRFRSDSRTVEFTPEAAIVVDVSDAVAEVLVAVGGIGMLRVGGVPFAGAVGRQDRGYL
ncbi:MAG: hypothetical protein H7274_00885 [Rhodoferax sp.]|nr:hypothetical protein [Rhodoferax sp.]